MLEGMIPRQKEVFSPLGISIMIPKEPSILPIGSYQCYRLTWYTASKFS